VRAEGAGRAMRPRDASTGNEGGAGNVEVRGTSKHGRPDACVGPDVRALPSPFV
jgi:hypothetical protein